MAALVLCSVGFLRSDELENDSRVLWLVENELRQEGSDFTEVEVRGQLAYLSPCFGMCIMVMFQTRSQPDESCYL
jgi:hypothetical protein